MSANNAGVRSQETPLDRAFQRAYALAYRLARVYWRIRRPATQGALVALWQGGEVLLIRNSYVPHYSVPGGYLARGEEPQLAALRELREEVGIALGCEQLVLAVDTVHDWEGKRDHVRIYEAELARRPQVSIDRREVIDAAWYSPAQALQLLLFPPLRRLIERRRERAQG